ncbi:MAG: peptidoglycan-associated lipoprotein Pal [Nitrospirota bacterium]|nr:MAG: peptidoglycan-associated lipoprotein Pal [Nitrospirota bacterium]
MKKVFLLLLVFAFLFSCAQKQVTSTQEEMQPSEEVTLPDEGAQEAAVESVNLGDVLVDIHFDFDRYEIKEGDKATLKAIADVMIQDAAVSVRIEGHCDERGTNEYNLGLGDNRANAAKSYLMTLGVPSSRILTISYGEERPICTQSDEGCWARNRRAHFTPAN